MQNAYNLYLSLRAVDSFTKTNEVQYHTSNIIGCTHIYKAVFKLKFCSNADQVLGMRTQAVLVAVAGVSNNAVPV